MVLIFTYAVMCRKHFLFFSLEMALCSAFWCKMRVTAESKTRKPLLDVQDMGGGTPALPASPLGHARVLRKNRKSKTVLNLLYIIRDP